MSELEKFAPLGYDQMSNDLLLYQKRICVPDDKELRQEILSEAHKARYRIYLVTIKMYKDL